MISPRLADAILTSGSSRSVVELPWEDELDRQLASVAEDHTIEVTPRGDLRVTHHASSWRVCLVQRAEDDPDQQES